MENATSKELKTCSCCKCLKNQETDFYKCQGKFRSDCKACTIKKNTRYQKRTQPWKHRFSDEAEQRTYMVEYYAKHKERFAEYRKTFKNKHPDYYKEYARRRKNESE